MNTVAIVSVEMTCLISVGNNQIANSLEFNVGRGLNRYNIDLSLLAGIDLQIGVAIPLVRESHNNSDYIEFLRLLDRKYSKGDRIRLILDNLKVRTSEETRKYLAIVLGRFEFVFTPKRVSWLNIVEGFYSELIHQSLKGDPCKNKRETCVAYLQILRGSQ